jgi:hypothetical protein
MTSMDDTWRFWVNFISHEYTNYSGLWLAMRSGNWQLRMTSIKWLAPLFYIFDRQNYRELILHHLAAIAAYPRSVIRHFEQGGFVVSLSGTKYRSVALDEAHEMVINKKTKAALNYTNPDYIQKMSDILPHQIHMMSALHKVFFPTDLFNPHDPDHVNDLQLSAKERKSTENISEGIARIKEKQMFQIPSKNLLNPFSNQQTNTEQALDLLTFLEVGEKEFKSYYEAHMVKTPSTQVSKKRYSLKTFESQK